MRFVYALSFLSVATLSQAAVNLSKVFTPHMVLQREMPVPIWGTASPGEKVDVSFAGQSKSATADAQGAWRVTLDPLAASKESRTLTIADKKLDDVLVGDVWLGSGQSNMDTQTLIYLGGDPVLGEASAQSFPYLRLLRKEPTAVWETSSSTSNTTFSALMFCFGFALQKEIDVPVGLMLGAEGGSPSAYWLTKDMLLGNPDCAASVKKYAELYKYDEAVAKYNELKAKYDKDVEAWQKVAEAAEKEGKQPPAQPAVPYPPYDPSNSNSGTIGQLFESFIRPYVGYAIKGVLWDQGENGTNISSVDQVTLMGGLIGGWRKAWGQGEFPWLYVEKPSGGGCAYDYSDAMHLGADPFAPLPATIPGPPTAVYSHEVFVQFMKYPRTHMITSSDLGSGVHPPVKSAYGARAVQVALATAYGKKGEYLGPLFTGHTIAGGKVALKFSHAGSGLAFKNGDKLQGFMIAGEDRKFVWADAAIAGDAVVVSSKEVPKPASVRYAWSDTFPWANLFNKDGFPVQPFRTDSW